MDLSDLREEYQERAFGLKEAAQDPFDQFTQWFEEAKAFQVPEPNAMVLATADAQGHPSSRTLLMKHVEPDGLDFFTHYESQKGRELAQNPWASATFLWLPLQRQVTIQGRVERLSDEFSEAYFRKRPRESQLAAWASRQDQVIKSREELLERFRHYEGLYAGQEVPKPPYWGGFRLKPHLYEFWQGREHRLHDRVRYRREDNPPGWIRERLMP